MTSITYGDIIRAYYSPVSVPSFDGSETNLECAIRYQSCGWWIVPVLHKSKHPGSVLGMNWPELASNSQQDAENWFSNRPDLGIALVMGKSRAIAFDVDHFQNLPLRDRELFIESGAPFQSTRDEHGRGHYLFGLRPDQHFTNSTSGIGSGWGEIRAGNSVIMVYPSTHEKSDIGGRYQWQSSGPLPSLPDALSRRLKKRSVSNGMLDGVEALDDQSLRETLESLNGELARNLLDIRVEDSLATYRRGSRHEALKQFLLFGFRDARAGLYPALEMVSAAFETFLKFKPRDEWSSPNEFWDLVRWTAAASSSLDSEQLNNARIAGSALASPGIRSWFKAVSNG